MSNKKKVEVEGKGMNNLFVVNLNEYERIDPSRLLNQGGQFYTNGTRNEFFYKTESLFLSSPTNASIIKKYTNLILGDGIVSSDKNFNDIFKKKDLRLFIQDYKIHGNAALRLMYNYNGDIAKVKHIPTRCIAIGIEDDIMDETTTYYFNFDWTSYKYKEYPIPAFSTIYLDEVIKTQEVAYLKSPSPQPIFSLPDWFSGFQYCEMEMEMSNFFIKHITTGFSGATVINVNQGNSIKEGEDELIKKQIVNKLTGTSGDRVIVSINDNKENATTVENLSITDAYQQFDFVEKSTREKIMMAHSVNDAGLFGLPTTTGFSSDSEKIIQSRKDLYRDIINPMREEIIEFLEDIFPGQKLEFKDFEEFKADEVIEEEEDVNLKKKDESVDTKNIEEFINKGETIDLNEWELVDEKVMYIDDDKIDMYNELRDIRLSDTGTAIPNSSSEHDIDGIYKVRYRYDGAVSLNSREFCIKMKSANKVYRFEDIDRMELSNPKFAPSGMSSYSIWLYKGGCYCHHAWKREIYANKDRTKGVDPNNPNAEIVDWQTIFKEAGKYTMINDPLVYTKPINMPNRGKLN